MRKTNWLVVLGCCVSVLQGRVVPVGENPESVCRGFGGKLYVTVMNTPDTPGDGVIKIIEGDELRVFATGLDEPKGMAFTGDHLITADVTRVWKIDAEGRATVLADADAFPFPPRFLNDVALAPDGRSVYVSDTGDVPGMFTSEGVLWPVDSAEAAAIAPVSRVYRITMDGEVSVALDVRPELSNINGVLAPEAGLLLVAEFFAGDVYAYQGDEAVRLASGLRGADGIARDQAGRLYISSWTQGKVWRIHSNGGDATVVVEGLQSAADFYLDEAARMLVVPDMKAGTVLFREL